MLQFKVMAPGYLSISMLLVSALLALSAPARAALPLEVVSAPYTNIAHAFGDSASSLVSANGRWVAFGSSGNGLATNDHNGLNIDAFLTELETGRTRLISRSRSGASGNGHSIVTGIDGEGRWTLFESDADDLVENDDNEATDIFLYNREAGSLSLVSSAAGFSANDESGASQLTRSGQFILFESHADNLVANDDNEAPDLFLRNRETGEVLLVTANSNNTGPATSPFANPSIGALEAALSEDAHYIVFTSLATNLAPVQLPVNSGNQIYLRDMLARTNRWISQNGAVSGENVSSPRISPDGSVVAFLSSGLVELPRKTQWLHYYLTSSNLLREVPVPSGVTSGVQIEEFDLSAEGFLVYVVNGQVYRFDTQNGVTILISTAPDGAAGSNTSSDATISDDGNIVVFASSATNLVQTSATDAFQLFRYAVTAGSMTLLTPNLAGHAGANRDALFPAIDAQAKIVTFTSYASDLTTNDDKYANDVFLVETSETNGVRLISTPLPESVSATADASSDLPSNALSDDGRFLVFSSAASDLVPGDNNNGTDVFLRDLQTGTTRLVSSPDGAHPFLASSTLLSMSRDGRYIAFASTNSAVGTSKLVYVYDATLRTNSVESILPDGTVVSSAEASLSADGSVLAFRATSGVQPGLFVRDLSTHQTVFVTNYSQLGVRQFVLSPDGRYVVAYPNGRATLIEWKTGARPTLPNTIASGYLDSQFSDDLSKFLLLIGNPSRPVASDLYAYSRGSNTTNLITTNVMGIAAISRDGSIVVAWENRSSGLRVVIHSLESGAVSIIPLQNVDASFRLTEVPVLSRDGRFIALVTRSGVAGGQSNGFNNTFVYDREQGTITPVNLNAEGEMGDFGSNSPSLSADGGVLAFGSSSSNLVGNDRNSVADIFVTRLPLEMPLRIQNLVISAEGRLTISANTVTGQSYQLQLRSDLAAGNWQDVGAAQTANSSSLTFQTDAISGRAGFYRMRTGKPVAEVTAE